MSKSKLKQIKEMAKRNESFGKKLNLENLQKEANKFNETFTVQIGDWELEVKHIFNDSDINQLIFDVTQASNKVKSRGADFGQTFSPYVMLLMIKYFTSLGEDISNDINQQLEVLKLLVNEDLFVPIIKSLPEAEVQKVMEHIAKSVKDTNEAMDILEKNIENIKVENKEVEKLIEK